MSKTDIGTRDKLAVLILLLVVRILKPSLDEEQTKIYDHVRSEAYCYL